MTSEKKRIVLFGHEVLVRPHFISLGLVGTVLKQLGHEVFLVSCDGLIPRCINIDSMNLPPVFPL
ncbi:MAG: hypothetical protein K2Q10_03775, partial [Rhodospirillales bacterium]|nr:hypothetical protein [Rhodospirillales bacterium]